MKIFLSQTFSEFDLKEGFWQLGISPKERPKNEFSISDRHSLECSLIWTLKTELSLSQNAILRIFIPILRNAFVYIVTSYCFPQILILTVLLHKFLSPWLYLLQPNIATQIDNFLGLTFDQVQQLLGIVIYMADLVHTFMLNMSFL